MIGRRKRQRVNALDILTLERVFILFNPASTHAKRSLRRITELKKTFPGKVEVITTSPDGVAANVALVQKLANRLNAKTLLCIAAGDGTVSLVIGTLTDSAAPKAAAKTPILPLWGGNANDLAYMLNGLLMGQRLKGVLEKSAVVPIYPLQCKITSGDTMITRTAACYITFGVSGRMAQALNDKEYRATMAHHGAIRTLLREARYIVRLFRGAKRFAYDERQKRHHVYELIFANGSRIAKVDRLPIALVEPYFYKDSLEHKRLGAILRKLFNVIHNHQRHQKMHQSVTMTLRDQVWGQFDGEPEDIPAGSKITISISSRPFYAVASLLRDKQDLKRVGRLHRYLRVHRKLLIVLSILLVFHAYLHITNPYAAINIVQQPYTTSVDAQGDIVLKKNFDLRVYDNAVMSGVGYYKGGFLIAQNTLFGGKDVPGATPDDITSAIHRVRFDPAKPYLISGDQFSVLYIRNLGVFYHSLLDPNTALDQSDWEARQRIYMQSAMYALDSLSKSSSIKTTAVPIGPRSVAMTAVHPGSTGSDTVYGLFYALQDLATAQTSADGTYHKQTVTTAQQIIKERHDDLAAIYNRYIKLVADGDFVKSGLDLSSARDGATRQQSFYDSLVLWKTKQLAMQLGIAPAETPQTIEASRQHLLAAYWSSENGCFRDELAKPTSYSSDWLLAAPTGFLDYNRDYDKLTSCVHYIRSQHLAEPLPIRYTNDAVKAPWIVHAFAPSYGTQAIWSYWGSEYITLLAELDHAHPNTTMHSEAEREVRQWNQSMVQNHGYPETLDSKGNFLRTPLYKSIRTTGWVVQFEYAKWRLRSK